MNLLLILAATKTIDKGTHPVLMVVILLFIAVITGFVFSLMGWSKKGK